MTADIYPWQLPVWQYYVSLHQQQRVPHAILLQGINGLGKVTFAEKLVASLLCLNLHAEAQPCGQCHSCQLLTVGSHPDYVIVTPEEEGKAIRVDQIRDLKDKQTLMPKVSKGKAVLIAPADAMNISAYNSLLKLLEEPQQNSIFILVSEKPDQLPVTIRSRCQVITLPTPASEVGLKWLATALPAKTAEELNQLLNLAHGAPLQAVAIADHGLQHYQEIKHDMQAIMQMKANPLQITARWLEMDLINVMYQLQQMIQMKLRQLLTNETAFASSHIAVYWTISDCITETIKLISASNNLNKTLLIEAFLVKVMQQAKHLQAE